MYVCIKLCSAQISLPFREDRRVSNRRQLSWPYSIQSASKVQHLEEKVTTAYSNWQINIWNWKLQSALKEIEESVKYLIPTEPTNPTWSYLSVQNSVGPPSTCSCQSGGLSVLVNSGGHKIRNVNVKMLRTLRSGWRHRARLPFRSLVLKVQYVWSKGVLVLPD